MFPSKINRFEIKGELGRGGMASVFLGHDPRFKRDVAIKVLPATLTHDPAFRARFEREAQTIAALEYPGIVPVYDYGEEAGQPYLVMRFMPGGSLADKLKKGPLSLAECSRIFTRLGAALDYVHNQGIVHRDMKPANVLFDMYGNAYLSDFGIARIAHPSVALTGDGMVGTPAYMSPEQARGDSDVDGSSDIYALGAILFEMFTGKAPYDATTPMGIAMKHITDPVPRVLDANTDLPSECQDLIDRAMAKERKQRFPTAAAMAIALAAIAGKTKKTPIGEERTARISYPQGRQPSPSQIPSVQPSQVANPPSPVPPSRLPPSPPGVFTPPGVPPSQVAQPISPLPPVRLPPSQPGVPTPPGVLTPPGIPPAQASHPGFPSSPPSYIPPASIISHSSYEPPPEQAPSPIWRRLPMGVLIVAALLVGGAICVGILVILAISTGMI